MSVWVYSALAFTVALIPCGYLAIFGKEPMVQLVGLETAGILEAIILLLLAQESNQSSFYDVALTMSVLAAGGGLVFVRFLERWE